MYKKLKYFSLFVLALIFVVLFAGIYKFNILQDDIYIATPLGNVLPIGEYRDEPVTKEPTPPSLEEGVISNVDELVLPNIELPVSGSDLIGTWVWTETTTNADPSEAMAVQPQSDKFTVTFMADGSVNGTTDCNNFSGAYGMNNADGFIFGPLMSTLMYCEGSQEAGFHNMLKYVTTYFIDDAGELAMEMMVDGGALVFEMR